MIELSATEIFYMSITVFVTQIVFIGCRTWNVKAIGKDKVGQALISGGLVHLSWLLSTAIGVTSTANILIEFRLDYLSVILCSLVGGLIGTYIPMHKKKKKVPKSSILHETQVGYTREQLNPKFLKTIDEIEDRLNKKT